MNFNCVSKFTRGNTDTVLLPDGLMSALKLPK